MVPGVSPRAGAVRAPPPACLQHGLRTAGRSGGPGAEAGEGIPHPAHSILDELLYVPPVRSMNGKDWRLDLEAIRARLAGARGKAYWRCLEELAEVEGFQEFLRREIPRQASAWAGAVARRE